MPLTGYSDIEKKIAGIDSSVGNRMLKLKRLFAADFPRRMRGARDRRFR